MHWSYSDKADGDLAQGDILLPTPEMRVALDTAHKWFNDQKYLGFVVISQTCDLVRRDGSSCKTPYIEIAVVRPFRSYVLSLLRQHCDWIGDRYFPSSDRNRANDLIDRIINQNESSLGIFYLHPESSISIAEPCIVLLRVSIAMRAHEHYDTLIAARRGRLHPEFANKLGWLCGNLYSRVGVKDWKETEEDQKIASKIKKDLLSVADGQGPEFIDCPPKFLEDLRKGIVALQGATGPSIVEKIKEYIGKSHKDRALDAVGRVLESQKIDASTRQTIYNILKSDSEFSKSLRPGTV